jgi:tripartite-type tricarboxylate transporter receptor subunit TctC
MMFSACLARLVVTGALTVFACCAAAQQAYPNKPIRLITPFAPGGANSIMARIIGQKLTESWGQPVIVESVPGAGTIIGTTTVVKAAPDGYTLLLSGGNLMLTPLLFSAPYDPSKDLAPVASFTRSENMLIIHPAVPANNLKELIDYARARPGQLNYASPGAGTSQHLAHEMLNVAAEIKTQHIPYKGAGPATADLLGGQVQLYFVTPVSAIPLINSGKVKAMAITGETRSPGVLQVPTFAEAGLPALTEAGTWFGVIAPAGTPSAVIDKLSTEIGRFVTMPDFRETLIGMGSNPTYSNTEQLAARLKSDLVRYTRIIKTANIKMDN